MIPLKLLVFIEMPILFFLWLAVHMLFCQLVVKRFGSDVMFSVV